MSRVITFSRFFPATHPRKGEPTYDGLTAEDFANWIIQPCFKTHTRFSGQILCWNPEIEYQTAH